MSVTRADLDLAIKAAELARSSPLAWRAFLEEFRKYANRAKDGCIQSPIEELQVRQGIARGVAASLELFETCVKFAEGYAESQRRREATATRPA